MPQYVRQEDILGTTHRYLATGEDGGVAAIEASVPPGVGVPPHTHTHEDEMFYRLDGEISFGLEGADAPTLLRVGGSLFAPRWLWHASQNLSGATARMLVLVLVLPGGNLVKMFGELVRLSMPPDPAEVGAITVRNGVVSMAAK